MEPMRRRRMAWAGAIWWASLLASILVFMHTTAFAQSLVSPEQLVAQVKTVIGAQALGDTAALSQLAQINNALKTQGSNIAIEAIHFFTVGKGRPDIRMHQEGLPGQQGLRWVPGDPRRNPQGNNITYFDFFSLDSSLLPPGLNNEAQVQGAVDSAMSNWANDHSLQKLTFDSGLGFGLFGAGDITNFGWTSLFGLNAPDVIAVTFIAVFIDPITGVPTDINGDHNFDTAWCQTFYSSDFSWGFNVPLPQIDVQSVALHEAGHALGIGHFGPPPIAVMNPVYTGIKQTLFPIDSAGMSILFGSWPNP